MILEIKKRIEDIKNGIVPEGYKKTKVGIVPVEWEESFLSKYLSVRAEKNDKGIYGKEDVFSISGERGVVNQMELLGRSYAGESVLPYGVVYPNDVVYTKSPLKASPYGIIKTNKSNKVGIVSTLYAVFDCKKNVCPNFVQAYFEYDLNLNNYLYPIVNIGAKHDMKISDENSLKGRVVFPSLEEQQKIAEILATQDKIIELQAKKIDELKKLKSICLNKMFPRKGCNVPEIRFSGFSAPWEQRKLSELGKIETGNTPSTTVKEYYSDNGILWVTPTDIKTNIVKNTERKLSKLGATVGRVIPANSILCTCIASLGKNAFLPVKCAFNQQINALTPYDNNHPYFLFINSYHWSQSMKKEAGGLTFPIVNKTEFSNIETSVPKSREQEQIGTLFYKLDNLITLHQCKLDEMKKYKKALMQLLLTGIVRV